MEWAAELQDQSRYRQDRPEHTAISLRPRQNQETQAVVIGLPHRHQSHPGPVASEQLGCPITACSRLGLRSCILILVGCFDSSQRDHGSPLRLEFDGAIYM